MGRHLCKGIVHKLAGSNVYHVIPMAFSHTRQQSLRATANFVINVLSIIHPSTCLSDTHASKLLFFIFYFLFSIFIYSVSICGRGPMMSQPEVREDSGLILYHMVARHATDTIGCFKYQMIACFCSEQCPRETNTFLG